MFPFSSVGRVLFIFFTCLFRVVEQEFLGFFFFWGGGCIVMVDINDRDEGRCFCSLSMGH